ncbi:MAG: hypothetical protein PF485_09610 [Bacteroidales bacterium]|jgi:hypothetical protein|nr:hypothetical protein [Bacteroidales bacterium]
MINKLPGFRYTLIYITIILVFFSCKQPTNNKDNKDRIPLREIDTSSVLIKLSNNLFTIPSPYQATFSIKNSNIGFDKSFVNPPENVSNYSSNFKQAINIGIYGTDLGYLNIYDQVPDVISYFTVIKKLSQELGIHNAIQLELIDKIEKNIDNQDSLLYYLTSTYRQFDSYLKANNRKDIGVLIVTGGWIESLYILSQSAVESKNRQLINRLGEQKHPLDNLIEILSSYYYKSEDFSLLIDELVDLAYEFDGIIYSYSYEKPEINIEKKQTIVNSTSNVIISEYHLETIANKISSIRNNIIY